MTIIKRPEALRDLDEAADYIRRKGSPQRAIRFLRSAEETLQRLASMPAIGANYEIDDVALAGLRYFPIARHRKFVVFYLPISDGIEVVRVLHGSRDIDGILDQDDVP